MGLMCFGCEKEGKNPQDFYVCDECRKTFCSGCLQTISDSEKHPEFLMGRKVCSSCYDDLKVNNILITQDKRMKMRKYSLLEYDERVVDAAFAWIKKFVKRYAADMTDGFRITVFVHDKDTKIKAYEENI